MNNQTKRLICNDVKIKFKKAQREKIKLKQFLWMISKNYFYWFIKDKGIFIHLKQKIILKK